MYVFPGCWIPMISVTSSGADEVQSPDAESKSKYRFDDFLRHTTNTGFIVVV